MRRAVPWILAGGAAAFWLVSYLYLTLPDVRPLAVTSPSTTAFIELRADEARSKGRRPLRDQRWVRYNRISPHLRRAVLAAEDAAFWEHRGIDLKEIRASFETNVARGRMARGGSTITQQLAKNLYLSPSRNPVRKFRELLIARRLEAELPKRRILELYLNVIEWGNGIYGAEAASRRYFGKSAASLEPGEAALLAGAIVNARVLNPARPSARLRWRQRLILARMRRASPIAAPAPPARETSTQTVPTLPSTSRPPDLNALVDPADPGSEEPPDDLPGDPPADEP